MSFDPTRLTASRSRRIGGESPTMARPIAFSAVRRRFCTRKALASRARSSTSEISSISKGLVTYSYAPLFIALTAIRSEPCAVSITTGSDSSRSCTAWTSCTPSMSGIE